MRSRRLQREIDALVARGWRIEDETDDRVVMVDREFGSLVSHVLVAILTIWWTMGVGNVIWGAYKYVTASRRRVLWERASSCANCGRRVDEDAEYCPGCGAELEETATEGGVCPDCDAVVADDARYCSACGRTLSGTSPDSDGA